MTLLAALVDELGGQAICISGHGEDSGGLFVLDGQRLVVIDSANTTGLCCDRQRLYRVGPRSEGGKGAVLTVYDGSGSHHSHVLDALIDPHDVLVERGLIVAVSTGSNELQWYFPNGAPARTLRFPGQDDAWHLNSLLEVDGQLLVCAFGTDLQHRGWKTRLLDQTGFVLNLETGARVLDGLCAPHQPRLVDDAWLVCDSARARLLEIDPRTRRIQRQLQLEGWTRGLLVLDRHLLVGESALRKSDLAGGDRATVAVVNRDTWRVLGRFPLPSREVHDLVVVPPALRAALLGLAPPTARADLRSGQAETGASGDLATYLALEPGQPLPPEAWRVRVSGSLPSGLVAGQRFDLDCSVVHTGRLPFSRASPHPVGLAARWHQVGGPDASPFGEGDRVVLERTLFPGQTTRLRLPLVAPARAGRYRLVVTLVQEQVGWFDQADPGQALSAEVEVRAEGGQPITERAEPT